MSNKIGFIFLGALSMQWCVFPHPTQKPYPHLFAGQQHLLHNAERQNVASVSSISKYMMKSGVRTPCSFERISFCKRA